MLCLNLCEIHPQLILSEGTFDGLIVAVEQNQKKKIERVSIGSSFFCSQFFLKAPCIDELISYIGSHGWPITLTVPIFSQKDLFKGKERILQLCRTWRERIDEVQLARAASLQGASCSNSSSVMSHEVWR